MQTWLTHVPLWHCPFVVQMSPGGCHGLQSMRLGAQWPLTQSASFVHVVGHIDDDPPHRYGLHALAMLALSAVMLAHLPSP